jgi:hypothetical protein
MQDLKKGGVADDDIPKLEPHSPGAQRPVTSLTISFF